MCPILLKTPWFTIYAYGTFLALGYGIGSWWTVRRCRDAGLPWEKAQDLLVNMLIAGVLGSRLFHVIFEWPTYRNDLMGFFRLQDGGLSVLGGIMAALLVILYYVKRHGIPFLKFGDMIAPGLCLGLVFGRIGCLFNGCCYGEAAPSWLHGILGWSGPGGFRHPTQVYLGLGYLVFLLVWKFFKPTLEGGLFARFVIWYCLVRFSVEFLRHHKNVYSFGTLNVFQYILIAWGILGLWLLSREWRGGGAS
ncbi:MAG: hypothetical protein CVV64_19060 [Candidatus Wallbacteria bacterium HGW-Wallbacteria-1]|jgi:phosphatidylglycerol:prolipoprotein diacylglycerol transferase|uniref:Phosphatidylglycerol--prolipoprotein diacylglyceryl transferase n=1 Tax=Candidatus Wallbacteria bacterium HGW-Wallbacteria-1 TaxID=2013854 RepID=A0A2N1PJ65_9BACT|nr:MAG: hypothetical protein CVV64_19060 [Candidatus Wallbacteria bacterium HGW-Wallbacteria-1]